MYIYAHTCMHVCTYVHIHTFKNLKKWDLHVVGPLFLNTGPTCSVVQNLGSLKKKKKKNQQSDFPPLRSYQLQINTLLKEGTLCLLSHLLAGILSGLNLYKSCTWCQSLCKFTYVSSVPIVYGKHFLRAVSPHQTMTIFWTCLLYKSLSLERSGCDKEN